MRLEPELLRVLIAFAESPSMVEAARSLRITQPAVTQRLNRLQEQVPMPLYAYEGRRKVLTHYGKGLYELAKENLVHLQTGLETLNRRYAHGSDLVLRVGARQEFLRVFSDAVRFDGRVEYRQISWEQGLGELRKDHLDVLVSDQLIHSGDLISRRIFEGPSRLIYLAKHFSGIHSFRDLQAKRDSLEKVPCVSHQGDPYYFEKLCQALNLEFKSLNRKALLEDWNAVVGLVEQGVGYSVVPPFVHVSGHLKALELPHSVIPRKSYYAIFHKKLLKIEAFQKGLSFEVRSS